MIPKIFELDDLLKILEPLRKNRVIVFTNGCFDILHAGHVRYLSAAREEGDLLVIGLNSDRSVKEIKGDKRPVIPQSQRAEVLAGLWFVDYIVVFDEPDPHALIQSIRPHVLVKGDDWPEDQIIGADVVKADRGKVVRVPLVQGASTTAIIEKIVKVFG